MLLAERPSPSQRGFPRCSHIRQHVIISKFGLVFFCDQEPYIEPRLSAMSSICQRSDHAVHPATCSICHSIDNASDIVFLPGCGHAFHDECLKRYSESTRTPLDLLRCPNCRSDIGQATIDHMLQTGSPTASQRADEPATVNVESAEIRADPMTIHDMPETAGNADEAEADEAEPMQHAENADEAEPAQHAEEADAAESAQPSDEAGEAEAAQHSEEAATTEPSRRAGARRRKAAATEPAHKKLRKRKTAKAAATKNTGNTGKKSSKVKKAAKRATQRTPPATGKSGAASSIAPLATETLPPTHYAVGSIVSLPAHSQDADQHFCSKCNQPLNGIRQTDKGPKRYYCKSCKAQVSALSRMLGTWPIAQFKELSAEEQRTFYNNARGLDKQQLQDQVSKVLERVEQRTVAYESGGKFLPLDVWACKGFNVEHIRDRSDPVDIRPHNVLGMTYRLRIESLATKDDNITSLRHRIGGQLKSSAARSAPGEPRASASSSAASVLPSADAAITSGFTKDAMVEMRKLARQTMQAAEKGKKRN